MSEQVTTSAGILAPDKPEPMPTSHFSETVMHAERVHPVAWASPVSPPACRSEIVIAPESIRALGALIDHLPAAGMFVLLLTFAVILSRFVRLFTSRQVNAPHPEETFTVFSPPQLGSRKMAAYMAESENIRYWQHLLIAFAAAIEAEGYTLSTDGRSKVTLPFDTRTRAGTAIVKAKYRYLSPLQSAEEAEKILVQATEDGYAGCWADWCQRGAEAAGWYVIRGSCIVPEDDCATATSPATR